MTTTAAVSALTDSELGRRLATEGLSIRTGPFNFRIRSQLPAIRRGIALLYADYPLAAETDFIDFDVLMDRGGGLHRWVRPQVRFVFDGGFPFEPLPQSHAYPLLEWAMNWCISTQAHQYLILHAAVIERDGYAAILPAPPGSGKSTLCAGLICRGWRLLSDELTLISTADGHIAPLCRPVSLKNESIQVIRAHAPEAVFSDVVHGTSKGSVGHMKIARSHIKQIDTHALPGWVIFPRYVAGASTRLTPRSRADSMLELGRNAFNYGALGLLGFQTLGQLVDRSACYDFEYSSLAEAEQAFEHLARSRKP